MTLFKPINKQKTRVSTLRRKSKKQIMTSKTIIVIVLGRYRRFSEMRVPFSFLATVNLFLYFFLLISSKTERLKRENRTAMSYPADSETLEHLQPLTTRVQVLIKTIHSIRTQKKIEEINNRSPKDSEPPSLYRLIASKNSFKEILDEKLKNETFRTEMTWKRRLQRTMCDVMGHPAVEFTIMGFILANTVVLALHHHQIDTHFKKVLDVLNLVLVYVLLCHVSVHTVHIKRYIILHHLSSMERF